MMNDRLETWEIIVYPLIAVMIVLGNNWPPTFYWPKLLKLEVLLWVVVGVFEVYHWRRRFPLLSRAVLIGLPMTLTATLVKPGHARSFYWIAIIFFLYLGLLGWLSNRFDKWWAKHKRR